MSKETMARESDLCPGCGNVFTFMANHIPHCTRQLLAGPAPLTGVAAGIAKTLESVGRLLPGVTPEMARQAAEATVRNAGIGALVSHGPVADQPVQRRGARAKAKNTASRSKKHG